MKKSLLLLGAALAFLSSVSARPLVQQDALRLEEIDREIQQFIAKKKPGWRVVQVTPMTGSEFVSIQHWETGKQIVKIAILQHISQEDAAENIDKFAVRTRAKDRYESVGEEGYSTHSHAATITAFRKNNLTIYVSIVSDELTDKSDLTKEFAHYVDKALDNLSKK